MGLAHLALNERITTEEFKKFTEEAISKYEKGMADAMAMENKQPYGSPEWKLFEQYRSMLVQCALMWIF